MKSYSLDCGGSKIRLLSGEGDKVVVKRAPSLFQQIPENSKVLKNIINPTEDFIIVDSSKTELKGLRFTKGDASNFHSGKALQIDNQTHKASQLTTYINALHILASQLVQDKVNNPKDMPVGICIPTTEFYSEEAPEIIKDGLSGYSAVRFPVLDQTIEFFIERERVYVFPEGMIATMPLRKGKTDISKLLKREPGVVIDMGKRSNDVTPAREGRPIAKAARSFKEAGVVIEAKVEADLDRKGLPSSPSAVESAIMRGDVSGTDVGHLVVNAKQALSGTVLSGLNKVLTSAEMNMQEVKWIAVIGRPFKTKGKEGDPNYTGDLIGEIAKGLPKDVTIIRVENEELANAIGVKEGVEAGERRREKRLQEEQALKEASATTESN